MSFIFTMRSTHGRDHSQNTLPAISEDGTDYNFPAPPDAARRTNPSTPLRNSPTSMGTDGATSAFSDTSSAAGMVGIDEKEKPLGLRNQKAIVKRGGWKRLGLIAFVVLLCIIGLVVGLVIGLRNRNNNNNTTTIPWATTTDSVLNTTFPAGSWSITTFLSTISQNCTANPATWRCYPDTTYAQSATNSKAQFDWIIRAYTSTSSRSPTYTVSSTNNPFAMIFTNVTMKMVDAGLSSERYTFTLPMSKPVIPSVSLTSNNAASTCYFNGTVFEASLYTKMNSTYNNNTNVAFTPWPRAVDMMQVADSGSTVPECYDRAGNLVGNYSVSQSGRECTCDYVNYGT